MRYIFLAILCLLNSLLYSDTIPDKKKLGIVIMSESALYAGGMTYLYGMWYSKNKMERFHFFNDNGQWLQMDKVGHGVTAYHLGRTGYEALKWANVKEKEAVIYGGSLGLIFLTSIEILDGFSKDWGFSPIDEISNFAGGSLFIGQQLIWKEQKIMLKWSYHKTDYPKYRPSVLGRNLQEQWLKDYNGQTYWLSANINSFLNDKNIIPDWINISFGYSGEGMVYGEYNNKVASEINIYPETYSFRRTRQFFISPDIDLSRIKLKSKTLKFVLKTLNFIKIPLPALEYNDRNKLRFYPIYF